MEKQNFNLDKLIRPNVARLKPYSSARDEFKEFGKEMTYLDANENPNDTGLNRYPDPQQRNLKFKISELKKVETSNIILGNGSDEILDLIFRAFCIPSIDNIIIMPPTYGMYKVLAGTNDISYKEVLLTKGFHINVEAVLKSIDTHTKLIFICSPNNPSGNIFNRDSILKLLNNFNGIVVIDEAYIDFSQEKSWVHEIDNFENLIVCQTFSKAFGLAGIRLGMAFAQEKIIEVLNKIKPPYNVNQLTQERGLIEIENTNKVESQVSDININKDALVKHLKNIDFVKQIYHSDANFVLIKVDNANKRYKEFLEKGIVVRNRTNEPLCENCLRITVGTKKEISKLIKAVTN